MATQGMQELYDAVGKFECISCRMLDSLGFSSDLSEYIRTFLENQHARTDCLGERSYNSQ